MKFLSSKALIAIWSAVLQWARVGMNAVVFLVLSRWLSLSEIGVVAAVQAPIIILQSLVTTMLPEFIVQEKFLSQRRLSSVFWLSVFLGVCMSLGIVLASPLLVAGLNSPDAQTYMLVLSVCPLLWSLASVSEGLHRRALNTKQLALRTLFSSSLAASVAISAGYMGYGGWAIVLFTLLSTLVSSAITVLSLPWRPTRQLSLVYLRIRQKRMQALTGRHMLGAASMPVLQYATAVQLGTTEAGILQIAVRLFTLVESLVMTPYRFVVMPLFAMAKKTHMELAQLATRAVSLGCLIAAPAYFGLIAIAPALIPLAIGEKNGPSCVLAVQLLSINGVLSASALVINQILVARGHAAVVFKRSLLLYVLSIVPAVAATLHSVHAVALVYGAVGGLASLVLTWMFARKYLHIDIATVAKSWGKVTMAGACMLVTLAVYPLTPSHNHALQMALVLVMAPLVYLGCLYLFARQELFNLAEVIKARG